MRFNNNSIVRCLKFENAGKRLLSLLMAVVMLLSNAPVAYAEETGEETSNVNMELNSYTAGVKTVYIYNSMYATDYNGETFMAANDFVMAGSKDGGITVQIGDHPVTNVNETLPTNYDINVELRGVTHNSSDNDDLTTIVVNQVHSGEKKVIMTVTEASDVDTLIVAPGAKLELVVKANLTVSELRLAEESSLEITAEAGVNCSIPQLQGFQSEMIEVTEFPEEDLLQTAQSENTDTKDPSTENTDTKDPSTENTDTKDPSTENTETKDPSTENTDTKDPSTENPDTKSSSTETPGTETPGTENPDTENPGTENPDTENPDAENPGTENPDSENDVPGQVPSSASAVPEYPNTEESAEPVKRSVLRLEDLKDAANGDVAISAGAGTVTIDEGSVCNLTANRANITVTSTLSCAGDLRLTNTNLTGGSVTASGSISVSGGKLDAMTFFGFPADVGGTITFADSPVLQNLINVGAPTGSNGVVSIEGLSSVSVNSVTFTSDFGIAYSHNGEVLTDYKPQYYRASYLDNTAANPAILGTISDGTFSGSTALPDFQEAGYTFQGWHYGEATYTDLSAMQLANAVSLALTTNAVANKVTVSFDRGYQPDKYTHDNPDAPQVTKQDANVGETITLPDSMRMGYVFDGWKVEQTGQVLTDDTHTILYSDLTEGTQLNLLAQWKPNTYNFTFSFGNSLVDAENIEISYDGGTTWSLLTSDTNFKNDILTFKEIHYGQTFDEYFATNYNGQMPILRDTRDQSLAQSFGGWRGLSGDTVSGELAFAYQQSGGALINRQNLKPSVYDEELKSTAFTMTPAWGTMNYMFTVSGGTPSNWSFQVGSENKTLTNGAFPVPAGATVTMMVGINARMEFSKWSIFDTASVRITPAEQPYQAGDSVLSYTFTMPHADVNASFGISDETPFYFDLAKSPITFAEGVTHNGLTWDGFWYGELVDKYTPVFQEKTKGYFYTWDNQDDFYVTSGSSTKNQLTVANNITVYLKNCNLIARDAYTEKVGGWNSKVVDNVFLDEDMTSSANIILSTDYHTAYVTDLVIDGDSTINCIAMSEYETSSEHKTQLNITGNNDRDKLAIDSILITHQPKLENLHITVPSGTSNLTWFLYGRATIADYNDTIINNCQIDMPNKDIDLSMGEIKFQQGTVADFDTVKYYGEFGLYGKGTFVHIHGDVIGNYNTICLSDNASLVVEGSVKRSWVHATANGIIDTDGYLVVKGNLLEFSRLEVIKGTIVANVISVGSKFNIHGGTVVANMITNKPYSGGSGIEANTYDTFPFTTYSQHDTSEQAWSIYGEANVYLFGYYKSNGNVFDTTVKATDSENPISGLITDMMDNKSLDSDLSEKIESYAGTHDGETFALGNSSYTKGINTDGRIRSVKIYGDAELYAAGNVTFYNETSIYGNAKITVYGTLGSRRDMTISGTPTIYAECIAGGGDLTYRDSNGNSRWAEIILQSGDIHVDTLGADNDKRNTLIVEGAPTVMPWNVEKVQVVQDICINYIYGSDFTVENDQKLDNARFVGVWTDGFPTSMNTKESGGKSFVAVKTPIGDSDPEEYKDSEWHYGSLDGTVVTEISVNGMLAGNAAFLTSRNVYEQIDLYAVKDSYTLTVKALDTGKTASYDNGTLKQEAEISLLPGQNYTLTLGNAEDIHKTVLWYQDPNGNLHNVPLTAEQASRTLTFTMPASNVELYITETLPLDLSSYSLAFSADGFMAELTKSREDSSFTYKGSYMVTQSKEEETVNLISVRENLAAGQTLTIKGLNQKIREQHGIEFCDNVTAELIVDGDNTVSFIHIPETADVTIKGKTGNQADTLRVHIYTDKNESGYAERSLIGSIQGKAGTITIQDLHLVKKDKSARMFSSNSLTPKRLTLENVVFDDRQTGSSTEGYSYNTGSFAVSFQDILIQKCDLFFKGDKTYQPVIFNSCKNVTIDSSVVTQNDFGSSNSNGAILFATITGEIRITGNSDVTITRENSGTKVFHEYLYKKGSHPAAVYVADTAKLTVEGRLALFGDPANESTKGLVVSDSATVEVTNAGTSDSYLLCNELTVSGSATVKADYVIISAFTWPDKPTDSSGTAIKGEKPLFETWASQASNADRVETGVLTQTGGTIHAIKFIGGAYGATLNIEGGELNSAAIGTVDAIFGYATLIPPANQEQVYQYTINAFNCSSTVNITGGRVNISENGYLGGHNSTVRVSGGEVKLGAKATMGMTDAQLTNAKNSITATYGNPSMTEQQKRTLFNRYITGTAAITGGKVEGENAAIHQPYQTVAISGAGTAVKVSDLTAPEGSITIQNAAGTYDIPEYKTKAGVYVANTMTAQSITISNQAMVYAGEATVVIPQGTTGCLKVESINSDTRLYVTAFGASGQGSDASSTDVVLDVNTNNKNLYYINRIVPIYYHLNGDATDPAVNHSDNPNEYAQSFEDERLPLWEPSRHGYDFGGWYDASGGHIPHIDCSNSDPVHLYAKWIPKKVTFRVIIDSSIIDQTGGIAETDLSNAPESLGTYDAQSGVFTYIQTFILDYGTQLQGGTGIDLDLLNLPAYQILAIEIADHRYQDNVYVDTNTIIGAAILDPYLESGDTPEAFTLRVKSVQMRRANLRFYLNQSQINPRDAAFVSSANADFQDSNTRASWVDFGAAIRTGNGLDGLSAKATGYDFLGWCSQQDPDESPEYLNLETPLAVDMPTAYYAAWKAKEYTVTFSADEGGMITDSQTAPENHDSSLGTEQKTVAYDSKFGALPSAWKQGYTFQGWYVGDKKITENTVLNQPNFADYENLTVTARFEPIKVTYHMMGGSWAANVKPEDFVSPGWDSQTNQGNKLPGYKDNQGLIHSTAAAAFKTKGAFDDNDYRNTLGRKGYTFQGWYLTEDAAVDYSTHPDKLITILPYEDINAYAAWSANTYTLNLNPKDAGETYAHTNFSHDGVKTATVTVGERIAGDGVSQWPDRTNEGGNWYVSNKDGATGSNNRYLLGFTFDALDPGGTQSDAAKKVYQEYALLVTVLRNTDDTMMEKDRSVFNLPEAYPVANVDIPDYPDGSTIEMYAVYRERSLVFIEYYTDVNNQVQQKEMYAADWNQYCNYPYASYQTDSQSSYGTLSANGYTLIGWRFLAPTVGNDQYPDSSTGYTEALKEQWKKKATEAGHYDLRIYTVYAAQATTALTLNAKESPMLSNPVDTVIYHLPGSMQNGNIAVKVSNPDSINLVTPDQLQLYSTDQAGSNTSDNTVAIGVKLIDTQNYEYDLGYLTSTGTTKSTEKQPGAGWKIKFELYTTKVITQTQNLPLTVTIQYTGNLDTQWIKFENLNVKMVPTEYSVTYDANLPKDDNLKVTDWNGYNATAKTYQKTAAYDSNLTSVVPILEGYTANGTWYQTRAGSRVENQSAAFGGNLIFPVSAADNGRLYVETDWSAIEYAFNVSQEVLDHWTITYQALNINQAPNINQPLVAVQSDTTIPYHATVYFTPKDNDPAEFVRLKSSAMDSTLNLLDGFNAATGVSILMGAEDMTVSYEKQRTLYLEDGTIDIDEVSYKQNGKTVTWHGDYVILMDKENNTDGSATANVLNLNGSLAGRTIALGSLNITSNDSIALAADTTAVLTHWQDSDTVAAKNVLAPGSASLTMENLDLTLTPAAGYAAVGGNADNAANGSIALDNVTISMTLPASSYASGIGAATNDAEGKAITLTDCTVTATQASTAASHYHGAWIGGKNVESVSLSDTTLQQGAGSSNHTSAYAVNAQEVTITDSTVGSESGGIGTPIHAQTSLILTNSYVYQSVDTIAAAPIGTETGGTITITKTKVNTVRNSGTGDLYTGTMILDEASEVVIDNTLILEMKHGAVDVYANQAVQGGHTFLTFLNTTHEDFAGSYLLLQEQDDTARDITVHSISDGKTVTVKAPADATPFQVKKLTVENSVELILDGSTTMAVTTVSIDPEKSLDVTGNEGTVQMAQDALKDSNGIYSQTGGSLTSTDEISGKKMDVVLDTVTVNSAGLIAENLTLTDSTVACGSGKVGSYGSAENGTAPTTVTISGTTTVTADTVGALGAQNETFTFVEMDDAAAVDGTLVRDWYRIAYQIPNGATAPGQIVFRTESGNAIPDSVPEAPINMTNFNVWYYLNGEGDAIALSKEPQTEPGYAGNDVLRPELIDYAVHTDPADTTKTLTLYAGVKFKGDAAVRSGRLFYAFKGSNDETTISIPANGVLTAEFDIEGTATAGSYYQFAFRQAIPSGTKLTLTVISDNTAKYYSYVAGSETKSIQVNDFTEMGKGEKASLPAADHINNVHSQKFILAMDFGETSAAAAADTKIQAQYCIGESKLDIEGAAVTYSLSAVNNGSVTADSTSVNVTLPTSSVYANSSYVLVAKIDGKLPTDVKASLNDGAISGTLIQSGLVFPIDNGETYTYSIGGMDSTYTITWALMLREDGINVLGVSLDESDPVQISVTKVTPDLDISLDSIDGGALSSTTRTLQMGTEHTVVLKVNKYSGDYTQLAEVQSGVLSNFTNCNSITLTQQGDTITATFPVTLDEGVYRLCFSLKEGSKNDNVYYTFVVVK